MLKFGQGSVKHTKMPPVRSSNLDSGLNRTKVACPQFFVCRSRFSCGVPIVGSAGVCLIIAEKTLENRKAKASLKSFVPFHHLCTFLVDNCVRNLGRYRMITKPA